MTIPYKYFTREIPVSEGLRSGLNSTGSTIPECIFVTGNDDAISVPGATTTPIFGVTRKAVLDGTRGPLMQSGRAILVVGATDVVASGRVMAEAGTGKAIPWTSGNAIGGIVQTAGTAGDKVEVDLAGAGATAQ